MLESQVKTCPEEKRFPLKIVATEIEETEIEFQRSFIINIIPKIDWGVLRGALEEMGLSEKYEIGSKVPENYEEDETFLQLAHHILLEIEIITGKFVCRGTGREFPIENKIANMLLTSEELN
ncbi:multifunctional methyltransferase subunit trm112-like protein [Anaeramoeba flamelloides]|nr:multifunctional methyltransferase subunit trm112-like protein [Anaeramoeba flamelloides]